MAYLKREALENLGLRHLGQNVLVGDGAALYNPELLSIGDNSRIDDFTVVAGEVTIGRNVHVTVFCNLAGGRAGVTLSDFSTLAYGCHIVAQTDDYSGRTMANSTVPARFKHETSAHVRIGRHAILGAGCIVLPGVDIGDGVAGGAGSVFVRSTESWSIYMGVPARRTGPRATDLLELEAAYLAQSDPSQ
jgi:acetyltransferase-like isoleucine patch superfamily enzyme